MKRKFRLTKSTDFKRVRQFGKSFAHPLVVLIVIPNELGRTQIAVAASRAVGNAIARNRAKRRVRAVLSPLFPQLAPGWDVVVLCRSSIAQAKFIHIQTALHTLLKRAQLLNESA